MKLAYLNIKGFVGTTPVDLNLSIPVEELLNQMPQLAHLLETRAPDIIKAFTALASGFDTSRPSRRRKPALVG